MVWIFSSSCCVSVCVVIAPAANPPIAIADAASACLMVFFVLFMVFVVC